MSFLAYTNWPSSFCTSKEFVASSVTVKKISGKIYYGMNADTDSLKFGAVSPGTEVERSIFVEHTKDAQVSVSMLGDLASWVIVNPHQFRLPTPTKQRVIFTLLVPPWAKDGNYTGKVEFCFKE